MNMSRQSAYKRIRSAVDKQKTKVILEYMRNNWDVVLNSSVSMLKTLDFRTRFRFALDIMLGKKKRSMRAIRGEREKKPIERPGVKHYDPLPPRPDVMRPPQKPRKTE
jgi:hypothetical protein